MNLISMTQNSSVNHLNPVWFKIGLMGYFCASKTAVESQLAPKIVSDRWFRLKYHLRQTTNSKDEWIKLNHKLGIYSSPRITCCIKMEKLAYILYAWENMALIQI